MGEAAALSFAERGVVIDTALATGLTVTVGVSAPTTGAAVTNVGQAADAGAHGVMCLPPTTYDPTERELHALYETVAGTLPLMAYNNPEAARIDMSAEVIAGLPGITAVKECSGDARRIAALADSGLEVLVGGDDWALEGFAAGATGWVSGVANAAPEECVALLRHVQDGELDAARELNARLLPLGRLDMTPKLVQYFKAAQDAVGRVGGPCRPPRLELTAEERALLDAALGALRGQGVAA
jgi:4-hydroxy-tetrahydrodipicolinate synthase